MVKTGFSLKALLNQNSMEPTAKPEFRIELISAYLLEPSQDNFYSVEDIEDIKDSIELLGIQQNLVVKPILGTEKYKVIAGHRRRLGILGLLEEGKSEFEYVPCRVESNPDEILERIILINVNSTMRQFSDWEKVEQVAQLKELLREYKKTHDIPGRLRNLIAETLNISPTQAGRMESINDNLVPELKTEFQKGDIGFSAAAELSRLSPADQRAVYEQSGGGKVKAKEIKKYQQQEPQNQNIDGFEEMPVIMPKPEPKKEPTAAGPVNPTVQAMKVLKGILEKERDRVEQHLKGVDKSIVSEYYRILEVKIKEVDKELFELMGSNMFPDGGSE